MTFCKFCSSFDIEDLISLRGYQHHAKYSNLVSAARDGCVLCHAVSMALNRTRFKPEPDETQPPEDNIADTGPILCSLGLITSRIQWDWQEDGLLISVAMAVTPVPGDALNQDIKAKPISPDASSASCFQMVSEWMKRCHSSHKLCSHSSGRTSHTLSEMLWNPQDEVSKLPSRIINVGGDENEPFLEISNGRYGAWIALSHCWGPTSPLTTTKKTLQERISRIQMRELPPTFRDAVLITRKLGYQYLWIDSLCILQDSTEDWQEESAHMGYIYKHASLTIAAEAAVDSQAGFFESTNRHRTNTTRIEVPYQRGNDVVKGTVYVQQLPDLPIEARGPLSSRAWTLQEDLLSSRTLRFASQQIWWSCREMQCNERDPDGSSLDSHWNSSETHQLAVHNQDEGFDTMARKILVAFDDPSSDEDDLEEREMMPKSHATTSARRLTPFIPQDMDPTFPESQSEEELKPAEDETTYVSSKARHKFDTAKARKKHPSRLPPGYGVAWFAGMAQDSQDEITRKLGPAHPSTHQVTLSKWYDIVNDFASRKMTFPTDKLPAIAGLAREVRQATGHRYSYKAGVWRSKELEYQDLTWGVTVPFAKRYPGYIAPSWSWASVDFEHAKIPKGQHCALYSHSLHRDTMSTAKFKTIITKPITKDPYMQVEGGYTEIEGPCCDVCSCEIPSVFFDMHNDVEHIPGPWSMLIPIGSEASPSPSRAPSHSERFQHFTSWNIGKGICDWSHELMNHRPVVLLQMGVWSSFRYSTSASVCLILERVDGPDLDSDEESFRRIGRAFVLGSNVSAWQHREVRII